MSNRKKEGDAYTFLQEFKISLDTSQNAANINRNLGKGSTCDLTVPRWFLKFCNGDKKF